MEQYSKSIQRLVTIMNELRANCPWDRKQTIHTLRKQTLEEVYELADSIANENWKDIKEELGDLLLHIVFYSKIGAEQGQFTLGDVIEGVCNKLVNRHPHIYAHVQVGDDVEVIANWEKIKQQEGKKSILSGVPPSMPALPKALCLQEKTKKVGFEWDNTEQVKEKVEEELQELYEAVDSGNQAHIEEEMGDVLFALINYARFINVDPERALELTNKKFIRRFTQIEMLAAVKGRSLHDMDLQEMDTLWNEVKLLEKK